MSRDLCFQSPSLVDTVPAAFPQQKSVKFFDMLYKLLPFHIITLLGISGVRISLLSLLVGLRVTSWLSGDTILI